MGKRPRTEHGPGASGPALELRLHEALTSRGAASLCRLARESLRDTGARQLWIDLEDVKVTDVVGVAALRQVWAFAESLGVAVAILPSPPVFRALLQTGIIEELPLRGPGAAPEGPTTIVESDGLEGASSRAPLAATARLAVRPATWDELTVFERWAGEPLLDQMVGSELLYLCRHLGPYHPDVVAHALHDPTSLTLFVEPRGTGEPAGFVRLFNVHLGEGFAFLETAIAGARALRAGAGIEASRLVLAWAMDALGIRRVEAKVYAYNVLSINALRRNGFEQEGVLRQARTYDGARWDILVFGILEAGMRRQRARDGSPYLGFWPGDAAP